MDDEQKEITEPAADKPRPAKKKRELDAAVQRGKANLYDRIKLPVSALNLIIAACAVGILVCVIIGVLTP